MMWVNVGYMIPNKGEKKDMHCVKCGFRLRDKKEREKGNCVSRK